ncbi:hypothetical protein BDR26DRAFT_936777 [Obelidium mucronatum]|nr:hypothetical protein BDR26DRAFT_936777 [Obelidium mucronatum]
MSSPPHIGIEPATPPTGSALSWDDDPNMVTGCKTAPFEPDFSSLVMGEMKESGYEEEDDFLIATTMIEKIRDVIFSVMFFMVHGNSSPELFEYISILIEDLQLVTFFISPQVAHVYHIPDALLYSQIEFQKLDISLFNVWFSFAVVAVFVLMLNIVWVGSGFVSGRHKFIWPIWTLRVFATVLPTLFYLPIIEVIVNPISCNRVHERESVTAIHTIENTSCLSAARLPLAVVAVVALAVYIPTSISLSAVFFDTQPTRKEPYHRVHGRLDMFYVTVKTILVLVYTFLPDKQGVAKLCVAAAGCIFMFCVEIFYFPYYNPFVNYMRAGLFFGSSMVGLVGVGAGISYSVTGEQGSINIIYGMVVALCCGIPAGFGISALLYNRIQNGVRKRLSRKNQGLDNAFDYATPEKLVFRCWTHVEIAARFITVHMSKRRTRIDFNAIQEVQQIFRRGIDEFPDQPLLRLSYALYMFHLKSMSRDATNQLNKIEQLNPPLDIKFQIYYTNQIAMQSREADFLGAGVKLDITSYAEYQKTDKDAKLNHFLAIQEMRAMWELLLDKNYSLEELSMIANKLYTHAQKAQDAYMKLISKFPKSKTTLRFFARFCFDVTNDVLRGDALTDRANDLELDEEESGSEDDDSDMENFHQTKRHCHVDIKRRRATPQGASLFR